MSAEMHTMVGAYALDAIDHREQVAFEAHLSSCPSCSDELIGFRATVERLGGATATTPPPQLRDAVLQIVAHTPQERRVIAMHRSERWRQRMPLLVAAASVLIAAGVGALYIGELNRSSQEDDVIAAADASTSVERLDSGTQVKVIASESMDSAVVVMNRVPALEANTNYQMWAIGPEGAKSLGVMTADDIAEPTTRLVKGIDGVQSVALTVEPEGGSTQPTTKPLVKVQLT